MRLESPIETVREFGNATAALFSVGLSQILEPRSILSVFVVKVIARYSHPQGHRGLTEAQSKTLGELLEFSEGIDRGNLEDYALPVTAASSLAKNCVAIIFAAP